MATANTKNIARQHALNHELYSKRVQRTFLIALNAQVKHASKHLPDIKAFTNAIENISAKPMKDAFNKAYKSILMPAGQTVLDEIQQDIGQKRTVFEGTYWYRDWLQRLQNWIDGNAGDRIDKITENTKQKLRDALSGTYADDSISSNQDRAKALRQIINDPSYNRTRSMLIARTETTTATNISHKISADSLSQRLNMQLQKSWISTIDSRTRDSHEEMVSYPAIGQDEYFIVGGEFMQCPGDPSASAANVCNCRCRVVYNVVRGTGGMILPLVN